MTTGTILLNCRIFGLQISNCENNGEPERDSAIARGHSSIAIESELLLRSLRRQDPNFRSEKWKYRPQKSRTHNGKNIC